MKENYCVLAGTLMFIIAAIIATGAGIYNYKQDENYYNSEEYQQLLVQQENCEHQWVTVSKGRRKITKSLYKMR